MPPGIDPQALPRPGERSGEATRCSTAPAALARTASRTVAPRTWLILGDKAGDNAQVRIIADALGWPYDVKGLVFRAPYVLGKPRFRTSLYHVDQARSAL